MVLHLGYVSEARDISPDPGIGQIQSSQAGTVPEMPGNGQRLGVAHSSEVSPLR